ncbi:DNA polymerase-4 [Nakamurella panacisegetis]|uniref:DNA-directed DNA polymerase n=1 Tax=Nakamurella panacisegetis TaxID=1090615 RepID=A0A1H0LTK3_9ACTN|nr:DNA polymerase IV [Nakamurella panacisegetis]SDO71589.1 DNA polymerase-4 [Nakamurella panacisegetis]
MAPWVLHVDLDQFIAAVEVLRRPELRGRPVVVGGNGDPTLRSVVATASYEARAFGVRSGMPMRLAARKCPDAVFLPADRPAYEEASARVMEVLRTVPVSDQNGVDVPGKVEILGWDEAFVGVETEDPAAVGLRLQQAILDRTQLWASVGIGDNVLRAKMATDFGKPRGTFTLTGSNWFEVVGERSTSALWGIGPKTAKRLAELGLHTVRELADADPKALAAQVGPTMGPRWVGLARGDARSEVIDSPYVARARSRETTFQHDLTDWADVYAEIDKLARHVTEDVIAEGRPAVRIGVKVRFKPFVTVTRSRALAAPTQDPDVIAAAATQVAQGVDHERPIRLLGVRAEFAPDSGRRLDPSRGRAGFGGDAV